METNPLFRIKANYRNRISKFIKKRGLYRIETTTSILGTDWNSFKTHIENLFVDGMTWDNYGIYGWHIDHKRPLSHAITIDDLKELNHYTNLQPMWAEDNIKKGSKYGTTIK